MSFQLLNTNDRNRRGRLVLAQGNVETQTFMPVGTLASVETLTLEDLLTLDC